MLESADENHHQQKKQPAAESSVPPKKPDQPPSSSSPPSSDQQQNVDSRQQPSQGQPAAEATATSPSLPVTSYELAHFEPVRVLNNNSTHKTVALLGRFGNLSREQHAIVVLEKTAFTEAQLKQPSSSDGERSTYFTSQSQLRTEFINDVYGNFLCVTDPEINQLKVTIIYPASEKHIVKFSAQAKYLVEETAEDYQSVTLPHLEQEQLSLEWLYNVLEHRKEKDRIVFEDPSESVGFILLPDLKWDGKTIEQLYLLALVHPRGIKSLRDLTGDHLPLLRNIQKRGTQAIQERYGIEADQLRVYLHYQPTFYHLHVHFTYLKHDPPGIQCEKSHLLSTVIGNLELLPEYYQKATLACVLKETDKLYEKFQAAKRDAKEPEVKRAKLD